MSKRQSPMPSGSFDSRVGSPIETLGNTPPLKRTKENNSAPNAPKQDIDPEQMGDVLNAAGVDLREEESLLSKGLLSEPGGLAGARLLHAPKDGDYRSTLLNSGYLRRRMATIAAEQGLKLSMDAGINAGGMSQDVIGLISTSCEEWLGNLLEEAATYSRHRRLALNPTKASEQSEVTNALKELVKKDRDEEAKYNALKAELGLVGEPVDKDNETDVQKAANDTARIMAATIGRKKKFSWMTDGPASGSALGGRGSVRRSNQDPNKFKEIKEENGIVVRDLLPALERKHMGAKRALVKGYATLRN